jgi:hypothetical protein
MNAMWKGGLVVVLAVGAGALLVATRDPLPEIWSGKLWLYDPELETWVQDDWIIGPSDTH